MRPYLCGSRVCVPVMMRRVGVGWNDGNDGMSDDAEQVRAMMKKQSHSVSRYKENEGSDANARGNAVSDISAPNIPSLTVSFLISRFLSYILSISFSLYLYPYLPSIISLSL